MPRVSTPSAEIGIYSFGRLTNTKDRMPVSAQYFIDVSGLRDPSSNRGFRKLYDDGRAEDIQNYVKDDPRIDAIFDAVRMIAHLNLRSPQTADLKWLSIAFRDHHGRWTAPAVAEIIGDRLSNVGYKVSVWHYDLKGE